VKPTLLILAAGMGSRYGGLKQIDPVGPSGEIIIDYSIHDALRAGFGKVVFIIRKEIEANFRECVGDRFAQHVPVEYVHQELSQLPEPFKLPAGRQKPWGTGHAVLAAKDVVKEPFAALNADDFYGQGSFQLIADFLRANVSKRPPEFCMAGYLLRNTLSEHGTVSRGLCEADGDGYLRKIVETTKIEKAGNAARSVDADGFSTPLTADETASMNMWGFTPELFPHLEAQFKEFLRVNIDNPKAEFFLPSVVDKLIQDGGAKVKVLKTTAPWFGITYKEDKPLVTAGVRKLVDQGVYPEKLF